VVYVASLSVYPSRQSIALLRLLSLGSSAGLLLGVVVVTAVGAGHVVAVPVPIVRPSRLAASDKFFLSRDRTSTSFP
jgi:hypothetical protein